LTSVCDHAIDDGLQSIRVSGFQQMLMEARRHGPTPISLETPTGERNKMRLPTPGPLLNLECGLVAIEQRHADVKEYELRLEAIACCDCLDAVMHSADLVAVESQQHRKRMGRIAIVIGDENAQS